MFRLTILGLLSFAFCTIQAQEPAKFVGTWKGDSKVAGYEHSFVLTFEKDQWKIASTYTKEGSPTGTAEGTEIKFEGGKLYFVQKYIKKPAASWKGSPDVNYLSFKGDQLELWNTVSNKHVRFYDRVGPKPEVAKVDPPKPTPVDPPKPAADTHGYAGYWKGNCPGTSDSTLYLKVTKEGEKYTAEGHVLSKAKKYVGHFAPVEGKLAPGKDGALSFDTTWAEGLVGSRFEPKFRLSFVKGTLGIICNANRSNLAAAEESEFAGLKPPDRVAAVPKKPDPVPPTTDTKPVKPIPPAPKPADTVKLNLPPDTPATVPAQAFDLPAKAFNMSVSRDGKRVAVVSFDAGKINAVSAFDLEGGKLLWTRTDVSAEKSFKIAAVAASSDGKLVASDSGTFDRMIVLMNGATGKSVGTPMKAGGDQLAFHPSKPVMAFTHSAPKPYVALLDITTGKLLWKQDNIHNGALFDLQFSPKGDIVATLGRDVAKPDTNRVRLFDAAKGTPIHDFPAVKNGLTSLTFTGDGQKLAVYQNGKPAILVYDLATKEMKEITGFPGGTSNNKILSFSPDGKTLAVGTWNDMCIRLVDVESGKVRSAIVKAFAPADGLGDIGWLPDGERIVAASGKQVKIFRAADAKVIE